MIGTGYVGLVTGACFAEKGHTVTCLDIDPSKIDALKSGIVPFHEPGLQELVRGVDLIFTTDYAEALSAGAEIVFLCLPTPSNDDGSCNLSFFLEAAKQLSQSMSGPLIIVNKSTVPIGTAAMVQQTIQEGLDTRGANYSFDVLSNPEFLSEGTALFNCRSPDRVIIGSDNPYAAEQLASLYRPFSDTILLMDVASAELTKYAANAMLASRLSMMNALSQMCDRHGGNIQCIQYALAADTRIGPRYLAAGIGFGGSCLPKDLFAIQSESPIFDAILQVNQIQQDLFFDKIKEYFNGNLEGETIAVWGLSFKPGTDDLREAPSLKLIEKCAAAGARMRVYDPQAMEKAKDLITSEGVTFCTSALDAATGSTAITLVTEWDEFKNVDFAKIGPLMRDKALFDGRNVYEPDQMEALGFDYYSIGRHCTHHQQLATMGI